MIGKWCFSGLLHFNEDFEGFIICRGLECRISVHHVLEFEICAQKSTPEAITVEQYVLTMCNHFLRRQFACFQELQQHRCCRGIYEPCRYCCESLEPDS